MRSKTRLGGLWCRRLGGVNTGETPVPRIPTGRTSVPQDSTERISQDLMLVDRAPKSGVVRSLPWGMLRGGRFGIVFALALGASFVWMNLDELPVNFQMDGQVPEYLEWSVDPETSGASINSELNKRLYSFYYYGLGQLARVMSRMDILRWTYALEILAVSAAVYFFVAILTRDRWAALLGVAVVVWYNATAVALGGGGGMGLICGAFYPASAMALVALALSWRRAHVVAAFIAGLSFNLHGSAALFVSAMVLLAAWSDGQWRLRGSRVIPAALVCLGAAMPTVLWIGANPPPVATMSTADWLRFPQWVYPHHMIISTTPMRAWATLLVFVLPGILGLAARRRVLRAHVRTFRGWIIGAGLLLAIGYVFVEWIPVRQVAQMTFWRGTNYLVLLCLAFGLSYLVRCIRGGGFAAVAAAMTLTAFLTPRYPELAWLGHLGLTGLLLTTVLRARGFDRFLAIAAMIGVLAVMLYEASFLPRVGAYLSWRWPVAVVALACLVGWGSRSRSWYPRVGALCAMVMMAMWLTEIGVSAHSHARGDYRERSAALLDLAPAIERACPRGEIVIAPPDLRNPGAWARRGSYLCRQQLTAYAYGPWMAEEILKRMQWYLDSPVEELPTDRSIIPALCTGYRTRTAAQFSELRREYGVRLAVVEHGRQLAFAPVAGNDVFTVYDLGEPVP